MYEHYSKGGTQVVAGPVWPVFKPASETCMSRDMFSLENTSPHHKQNVCTQIPITVYVYRYYN